MNTIGAGGITCTLHSICPSLLRDTFRRPLSCLNLVCSTYLPPFSPLLSPYSCTLSFSYSLIQIRKYKPSRFHTIRSLKSSRSPINTDAFLQLSPLTPHPSPLTSGTWRSASPSIPSCDDSKVLLSLSAPSLSSCSFIIYHLLFCERANKNFQAQISYDLSGGSNARCMCISSSHPITLVPLIFPSTLYLFFLFCFLLFSSRPFLILNTGSTTDTLFS